MEWAKMRNPALVVTGVLVAGVGLLAQTGASQAPPRPAAPVRADQMPTLPLTMLDEHGAAADADARSVSLSVSQPLPVGELLVQMVRGTPFSIVPDPMLGGTFVGELRNLTVRQALRLVLPPLDLDFAIDGTVIRVFRRAATTRFFDISSPALRRTLEARAGSSDPSRGGITTTSAVDPVAELTRGVQALVSDKATFAIDGRAGLLTVTDVPERLERVALYLDAVQERRRQQVRIDARVIDVELKDPEAEGLDWAALAEAAAAAGAPPRVGLTGLRAPDLPRLLSALAQQGSVSVIAAPTLMALNNEPSFVHASTTSSGDAKGEDRVRDVTLSVTAQVSPDRVVTLSVTPVVAIREPSGKGRQVSAIREADTLARVANGETLVIAGFSRTRETRERQNGGIKGGWLGRTTIVTRRPVETLILLTPSIVGTAQAQ